MTKFNTQVKAFLRSHKGHTQKALALTLAGTDHMLEHRDWDGLAMMKYVLLHSEEFTNPTIAFLLGWMSISNIVFAEIINVVNSAAKKDVGDAIAGFIGFKCVIELANIYMNSMEEFPLKAAVGKLDFKRGRKSKDQVPMAGGWLFNPIYTLYYVFFKSLFFYFFPFTAAFQPFLMSLKGNVSL